MKILVSLLFFVLLPGLLFAQNSDSFGSAQKRLDTVGQKDIIGVFKNIFKINTGPSTSLEDAPKKSIYFSILPISSAVPGGGRALITSTTAGFYVGDRQTTNISNVTFTPYFNFTGRFGLPLRSNIWLNNNNWFIQGDTRFLIYPQDTWGLGGATQQNNKISVDYKYIRFYQSALKRITSYFFAGIGYDLDYHVEINAQHENMQNLQQFTGYQYGTSNTNSLSSGVTLNLLYDTRNNSLNPLPGCYSNLVYRYNTPMLGSNAAWQSLYVDVRKYIHFTQTRQQNMLALWTYYWTTLDKGVPYLDLPSIGWDFYNRSGRGIQQNRYRGQSLAYMEAEYRRDILPSGLLGFVLFANSTSVSEPNTHQFKYIHPAAGGGMRIKFNKGSNTNIALDYGFSKGYSGFVLALGEAF
jgi:Omp85 superfamily domain